MIIEYNEFELIMNQFLNKNKKDKYDKRLNNKYSLLSHDQNRIYHNLHSLKIKTGYILENLIKLYFTKLNFNDLTNEININYKKDKISLDCFLFNKLNNLYYHLEIKYRDDHDNSNKYGQFIKFKNKIDYLNKIYSNIEHILYFIDNDFYKNKKYYEEQINKINNVNLFYGNELYEYLNISNPLYEIQNYFKKYNKTTTQ